MVDDQRETIDHIDKKVENAAAEVNEGTDQIKKVVSWNFTNFYNNSIQYLSRQEYLIWNQERSRHLLEPWLLL